MPSTPGFWRTPEASATLDGALFNKAQIIDRFSSEMDMQTWKGAAGHSLNASMERGIITDFARKARTQLIREREKLHGASNEPHPPADGSIPNHFFCVLRPEGFGHQKARIVGMSRQQSDQSRTHMKESDHFVALVGH